jgi:hypothetical protein
MAREVRSLLLSGVVTAALVVAPRVHAQSPAGAAPLDPAPAPPSGASSPPAPAPAAGPAPVGAAPAPNPVGASPSAPPIAPPPPPAPPPEKSAKPAASGFQFAFRTGLTFPYGDATDAGGDALGDRYAWQVPIVLDLGARFAESFFAGVYLGIGFGSTGSDSELEAACRDDDDDGTNDITCNVLSLRAGLEGSYSFLPAEDLNPWIGYGIGYEATTATYTDHERGYKETVTSGGVTWAQLTLGLDLRKKIGVGPFLEVAVGEFNKTTTQIGKQKHVVNIPDKALHAWIMLGLRFVVNP